jgi:hypothetical protein
LPLSYAGAGTFTLPFGSLEASIIDEQGTRQDSGGIELTDGYLVQEFRLPGNPDALIAEKLELVAGIDASSGGGQKITLQLYDWQNSRWQTVFRSSGQCTVANPQPYISHPGGVLRAKFTCHASAGGRVTLQTFDIALRGHRP